MSVKSSTELMLYVVLTMPTLNKAYLFIFIYLFMRKVPSISGYVYDQSFHQNNRQDLNQSLLLFFKL